MKNLWEAKLDAGKDLKCIVSLVRSGRVTETIVHSQSASTFLSILAIR